MRNNLVILLSILLLNITLIIVVLTKNEVSSHNTFIMNSYQFTNKALEDLPTSTNLETNPSQTNCNRYDIPDFGEIPQPPIDEINKTKPEEDDKRDEIMMSYTKELVIYITKMKDDLVRTHNDYLLHCINDK